VKTSVDLLGLGKVYGAQFKEIPMPNGAVMVDTTWDQAHGQLLLAYFDGLTSKLEPGDWVEFTAHTDPWVMMGIIYRLRQCKLSTYFAAFDYHAPIEPYAVGAEPVEGQAVLFSVSEEGDTVLLRMNAGVPKMPHEMRMGEMNLPAIPAGKDIRIDIGEGKVFQLEGLALSLGESCRTLYVGMGSGEYRCAISHVPEVRPGDVYGG
jgi:hypothetical protein